MSTEMYCSLLLLAELFTDFNSAWQEHLYKEMTTRYSSLHNNARKVIDDANTEISELQKQIEGKSSHP